MHHVSRSIFSVSSSIFLLPRPIPIRSSNSTFLSSPIRLSSSISMSTALNQSQSLTDSDKHKFGFNRLEMYNESLAGTVKAYDRHIFLCFQDPYSWGPRMESSHPLPSLLFKALKDRKNNVSLKTNLTVCGAVSGDDLADGDVLIFPDMIRYRGLREGNVDRFVEDVLVKNVKWDDGLPESISGTFVFVCAHGSRDKRCGVCGPVLINKFIEEIGIRRLEDKVHVSPCSHIGGHKYAGNLIIYGQDSSGQVTGHWYGYVTPEDVPELLDSHIKMRKIIQRLWRGQMGSPSEDYIKDKTVEKLLEGNGSAEGISNNQSTSIQSSDCCQGVEGSSCCSEGVSKGKTTSEGNKI